MIEISQNLPLIAKTAQHFVSICSTLKYFDRDQLLKLPIGSLPEIDCAHASATQFFDDGVSADPFANPVLFVLIEACPSKLCQLFEDRSIAGEEILCLPE